MQIPEWLQENNSESIGCSGKKRKPSFVEKTLVDLSEVVKESIFSEEIAKGNGLLQGLDPRAKLFAFFCLLVTVALVHNPMILSIIYLGTALLAALSKISLLSFVKRVWLVVPLFTGIMLLPSLFNWVRPGTPLLGVWDFGHPLNFGPFHLPQNLVITRQGVKGALLVLLRVGNSVSFAVLLTLTTRWHELLKSLRVFFVPKVMVTTLEMTYRYIFVLVSIVQEMFFARKSRTITPTDTKEGRHFIAASMGTLFGKSKAMSEEVYASMVARGYTGEIHTVNRFRFSFWDWAVVFLAILMSLFLYAADKLVGGIIL